MKKTILFIIGCCVKINILTAAVTFSDLRCENLTEPIAIDNTVPHFSWKIQADYPLRQQYYEIQVASDSLQLIKNKADLWNSAQIRSSSSVMIPYKGKELTSRMLCYWRVRIGDEKGNVSAWSPVQRFGIGVFINCTLAVHHEQVAW